MTRYRRFWGIRPRASSFAGIGAAMVIVLALGLGVSACAGSGGKGTGKRAKPATVKKPNVVFVLTDDLSWNLIAHMPRVKGMQQLGTTFSNFFVADSLCCTSRATMFTGQYPHNTGVRTNFPPDGGYGVFKARGGEQGSYGPALQKAGYRTGLMGKYMNGYQPADTQGGAAPYVPPGWTEWAVAGNGYPEYDYNLNENGKLVSYGSRPADYLTDVLTNKSVDFIQRSGTDGKPFFLQVSTFAPHGPFIPAPRHAQAFPGLKAPRPPGFNELDTSDKPSWLRSRPRLRQPGLRAIDDGFRDRVRMVQAVDEMVGRIQQTLAAKGLDRDTYLIFGSDNGFHMGEHRLAGGKMTAFDSDIKVPYIVTGPGVPANRTTDALAQNTDLAPTFLELAGVRPPSTTDGRSLVPFLRGGDPPGWRDVALVEHVRPAPSAQDPDRQDSGPGTPPTYNALRTKTELYVEYVDGEREYYDLLKDPYALQNGARTLPGPKQQQLSALLYALTQCAGPTCAAASRSR
ncbi:sulfatase family protein [Actinomadura rudentiformis]|uniref:Sulfatase n=1 Tax=Actinomadura rudentiformis TaxID=359158 RepID=A0A6H9Z088_9ACTN|nr:sulfatase [Actinomadura rudentiformis]KAB2347856.1 sulfatase [Actinomadura rudentiformis]